MIEVRFYGLLVALLIAMAAIIIPAGAQFSPVAWGFPSAYHNADVTAFTRDYAASEYFENAEVLWGSPCCPFPSISQTIHSSSVMSHTDFYHSSETTAIGYPFMGIGCTGPMPGFGGGCVPDWCY
jgi:hypothetical protein